MMFYKGLLVLKTKYDTNKSALENKIPDTAGLKNTNTTD